MASQAKGNETQRAAGKTPQSLLSKGAITKFVRGVEVHPHHTEEATEEATETDGQHEAYCGVTVTHEKPHAITGIVDICDPKGRSPGQEGYCNEIMQNGDIILKV